MYILIIPKMSTSWEDHIGNFESLEAPRIQNAMQACILKTALHMRKKFLADDMNADENFQDPHVASLSFDEERSIEDADKASKPKFTYDAIVTAQEEYEEAGKKKKRAIKDKKVHVIKNKTKWFSALASFKTCQKFLLLRYVKEMREFYEHNNKKFPEESGVLSEFTTWASGQVTGFDVYYITPLILTAPNVSKIVEPNYAQIDQALFSKLSEIFKDPSGASPNAQINKMVLGFINFVKLIAVKIAAMLYHRKSNVNSDMFLAIVRDISSTQNEVSLDAAFYKVLNEYSIQQAELVEAKKEKTKKASEAKESETITADNVDGFGDMNEEDDNWDNGDDDI